MTNEIKNKKDSELFDELSSKREALRTARFSGAGGSIRNNKQPSALKKDVARILTELNSRRAEESNK